MWAALRSQLLPEEVLLSSVRFTDPRNGDVEADFIVLMPQLGAAVIEVKGGEVRYENGEWTTSRGASSSRRIHPVEQARRAKHALRRFLDRQPEWHFPLLRTEWLLALPMTDVHGDLGPEARRDLIIDRSDLPQAMSLIRAAAASSVNRDPLPEGDWVETALSLLLRADSSSDTEVCRSPDAGSRGRSRWLLPIGLLLSSLVVSGAVGWALGTVAFIATALATLASSAVVSWRVLEPGRPARGLLKGAAVSAGGIAISAIALASPFGTASNVQACQPGYEPCLPIVADLDCGEINARVTVTGDDPYRLDRDKDGVACEWSAG